MKNTHSNSQLMKQFICLAGGFLAFTLTSAFGQSMPTAALVPHQPPANALVQHFIAQSSQMPDQPPALTKFNLDFPGGTPKELVAAIEKAMGKPLNAIIPKEDEDLQMPPLKMNDVVVPQLFAALKAASRKEVAVSTGILEAAIPHLSAITDLKLRTVHCRIPQFGIFAPKNPVCRRWFQLKK